MRSCRTAAGRLRLAAAEAVTGAAGLPLHWQACTEMVMPMSRDGVRDAFWCAHRCLALAASVGPPAQLPTAQRVLPFVQASSSKFAALPPARARRPQPWDADAAAAQCASQWGVQPRPLWATVSFGARSIGRVPPRSSAS